MCECIALFSEKGGTGKTTLTANLAAALATAGKKVLVVDCDQQGSASDLLLDLGDPGAELNPDLSSVLLGDCDTEAAIRSAVSFGVSVLPAGNRLADTQVELTNAPGRDQRLRTALATIRSEYDFVLIDCPPGRGLLAIIALAAADQVILPMDPSRGGLVGVQRGIELAAQVRRHCADPLRPGAPAVLGVVLNRVQKNKTHQECHEQLTASYGPLYVASIPAAVCVDSAGWSAAAVVLTDPASAPARAISALTQRILSRGKSAAA